VFSLHTAPPFAALSYSWGDRLANAHINLDTGTKNAQCPISVDLSSALAHLKTTNKHRWLWVDAICINQASNKEKSYQVKIMRSIYSSAQCVYVWLGEAMMSVEPELDFSKAKHIQEFLLNAGINRAKIRGWIRQGQQVWWQRLWIIQEVVSCETVFVCIGHHCTPWKDFWCLLNQYTFEDAQNIAAIGIPYKEVLEASHQVLEVLRLRKDLLGNPDGESIFELLQRTSYAHVSHPPDRIYSLLGVASKRDRASIPIRFGQPLAATFTDVVMYGISCQNSLSILFEGWPRGAGAISGESRAIPNARHSAFHSTTISMAPEEGLYRLPTWIPNFMKPPIKNRHLWLRPHEHSASWNTKPDVEFRHGSLYMKALPFDLVYNVVPRHIFGTEEQEFHDLAAQFLVAAPDSSKSLYYDPFNGLVSHKGLSGILKLLDRDIYNSKDWFCFSTKRGFIGLSLEKICEGDVIVVPFGLHTPAILRPIHDGRGDQLDDLNSRVYALVGDCYVDGITDGELMPLYKNGKIKPYTYHLR
jgi:hypothetical protein